MSLGFDDDLLYETRLLREHQQGEDLLISKIAEQIKPAKEQPKTYTMDMDGVLAHHESHWPPEKIGKLLKPGIEMAKRIKAAGHKLVILTAKPKSVHGKIKALLAKQGVQVDDVTNVKPPAELYLDDRAEKWPRNYAGGNK
jgi:ribonucleotide monophosphatase NagD (HAD superfamily)